jgi:hypothetical protein
MLVAAVLLALHFALAVGSKWQHSTTSDELVHLTAGFSYWQNHDYRLHPENGILPQRWAALPVWLAGATFPATADNVYWRTSDVWVVGHQFFYETGEDHFPRLMAGRAMIALFSVGTGLLVFGWSRKFFGDTGALLSLAFFVFCPTFLAHGALVTSDICMTFFFLAAMAAWWRHLHDPRLRWGWLSAALLGLAFVAKYSALLLLPMMAIAGVVRAWSPLPLTWGRKTFSSRPGKLGAMVLSGVGHGVVVVATIWLCYGFRFSAANPALPPADHFIRPWDAMMQAVGGRSADMINFAADFRLLPEAFLYGFGYVLETVRYRAAFLNGEYSVTGWPSFFPWTFLLKTPIALILASAAALVLLLRQAQIDPAAFRRGLRAATPLLALFAVYWAASVTSHLNIGHRHILPTYPVLFIAVGALGTWFAAGRPLLRLAGVLLLSGQVFATARISPHFLAYFNELSGGPAQGYRHLVDSSLDWGQDLPGLKTWLERHNGQQEPVFISYAGSGEPYYYHIRAHRLAFIDNFKFPVVYTDIKPGFYCISATSLSQVYSPVGGPWTAKFEEEYLALRRLEPTFDEYCRDAQRREALNQVSPPEHWQRLIRRHELLRFARLCHYLRLREPDGHAGFSILIYHLTADEVARATAGSLKDWSDLLETASSRPR